MALMSGALEMCVHALGTCIPSCTGRTGRLFFMLKATTGSHGTRGSTGAHLSREARFEAIGHVAALELTLIERRGSEPYDTWQRRSPPQTGGQVRNHSSRDSAGVHLSWEVRSEAIGHVTAPEHILIERRGPESQDIWQCVDVCRAIYLLEACMYGYLVCTVLTVPDL
jgi:hypothetical protein